MKAFLSMGAGAAVIASVAMGHPGPRVWVSVEEGRITTYAGPYPPGDPANYAPSRVFAQALADEGDDAWFTEVPGFQMVPGGSIPAGTTFHYDIMGPLLWFDPGDAARCPFFEPASAHFATTPPVPEFAVINELFQIRYTGAGMVSGDPAFAFNGSSGDHNHLSYYLLGDGVNPGGGADGIYALPLRLRAGGFTASETFHLILGKNVSAGALAAAADVMANPRVRSDLDCDGDVDGDDFALFAVCRTGPQLGPVPSGAGREHCPRVDADHDDDVDMSDFGAFQKCISGSDVPADPACEE